MQTAPDGTITFTPVKVAPRVQDQSPTYATDAAAAANARLAAENQAQVDRYNAWAEQREPYSQRVRRWRAEQAK